MDEEDVATAVTAAGAGAAAFDGVSGTISKDSAVVRLSKYDMPEPEEDGAEVDVPSCVVLSTVAVSPRLSRYPNFR